MSAIDLIAENALNIGYRAEAILRDYTFSDVLEPSPSTRRVALATFTQTPPSYRSAALAVIAGSKREPHALIAEYRALGAPLLFVVEGDEITVWQVRTVTPPRAIERLNVAEIPALFERNRGAWEPGSIHRAKSIGGTETGYQLDFVDAGLLPAIEGEIHTKLDRLLNDTLAVAHDAGGIRRIDERQLFRVVFRLLAAKILADRQHRIATDWDPDDLITVLATIERYYSLAAVTLTAKRANLPAFTAAWEQLRTGINFSNISADDLAFVYENTLVTPETRQHFGTHSTPRQVAEYVVRHLELWRHDPERLFIYEPFSGAGIFLVSALRHLKALLPVDWNDRQRHDFLIQHLAGDEVDAFACEVSTLSLILADYPNANDWHIGETDLFLNDHLIKRIRQHNIILCNPPFQAFTKAERTSYPVAQKTSGKALAVLEAALDAHPLALGFVLPRPFILERQYAEQRKRIERLYSRVELVELPDRTFEASTIEASLLIASEPRPPAPAVITLRSTEIADRDRLRFLRTGEPTTQREVKRKVSDTPGGELWVPSLSSLWNYLAPYQRLRSKFSIHLGARWTYDQNKAVSTTPKPGFGRGLFNADDLQQFAITNVRWIDLEPKHLTHATRREWHKPKIIANAVRRSRGPWRIAAAIDLEDLAFSQQLLALWPKSPMSIDMLLAFTALLNGPLANTFVVTHSPSHRFRLSALGKLPIPAVFPQALPRLVQEYSSALAPQSLLQQQEPPLEELLTRIDAAVLEAYDLPPRLERQLLDQFYDTERPVMHSWHFWNAVSTVPGLRLAEQLSGRFQADGDWLAKVFRPLPDDEAALLRAYGE